MRKEIIFFTLLFLLYGCSGSKRLRSSNNDLSNVGQIEYVDQLKLLNVTNDDFDVQKITVDYDFGDERGSIIANLKFRKPDQYLISLRTKIGLEVARVFVKGDSVYLNDKINRIIYRGNDVSLMRNYGFSTKMFPLIFSDFIDDNVNGDNLSCSNGSIDVSGYKDNVRIEYEISCDALKANSIVMRQPKYPFPTNSNFSSKITSAWPYDFIACSITFLKYLKIGDKFFPEEIVMEMPLDEGTATFKLSFANINVVDLNPISFIFAKNNKIVDLK